MRAAALALGIALLCGGIAAAQDSSSGTSSGTVDQAKLALAKDWFHRLQTGDIDHSQLDDNANMTMDEDSVKALTAQVAPLGAPVTFVQTQAGTSNGNASYSYALTFKNGTKLQFVMLVDGNGKIAGLAVQSA